MLRKLLTFGMTVMPDPPFSRMLELIQLAERNGFEYGWTYDSHILWQESYALLPIVARRDRDDQARPLRHEPGHPRPDDHGQLVRDHAGPVRRPDGDGHRPRRLVAPSRRPEAGPGRRVRAAPADDEGPHERPAGRLEREGAHARVGQRPPGDPDARRRLRAQGARRRGPRGRRCDHPARRPPDHPVDHGDGQDRREGGRPRPRRAAVHRLRAEPSSRTTSRPRATRCAGSRRWSRTT